MGTIAKVTAGGATHLIASTAYATCTTGSTTAAKVATIQDSQDFTLINGETIHVYFTYSNNVSNPTLNVNSTGAKPIRLYGNSVPNGGYWGNSWKDKSIVSFTYNTDLVSTGCWLMNDTTIQTANSVMFDYQSAEIDYGATIDADNVFNAIIDVYDQTKNVNPDWSASAGVSSILNKPAIPSTAADVNAAPSYHTHNADEIQYTGRVSAVSGSDLTDIVNDIYDQLEVIPATQINSDWTAASGVSSILNKPTIPSAADLTPKMDGTGAAGSSATFARADHVHPTDTSRASSSHTHGSVTSDGKITATGITLANGDALVVTDSSASHAIKKTSITFDGSTTTQALTKKGTWESFPNPNWTATTGVTSILNKPSIPSNYTDVGAASASHSHIYSQVGAASAAHTHTYSDVGAASAAHTHGSITSDGKITATGVTLANGDALVVTDSSASHVIKKTSIVFDGSTATKALTQKGTWETFLQNYTETDPTVSEWAKAPSKPMYTYIEVGAASAAHTHTYSDVGAASAGHTHTAANVGAVPTSRTVNGKSLSSNITLTAADVGALPTTTVIPAAQVNSDWNATTGVSSILNKPSIPAAQVNANWTATTGVASILNKPTIPSTYSDVGAASAAHTHTYSQVGAASAAHTHTYSAVGAASAAHTHAASAIIFTSQRLDATDVQNAIEEVDARIPAAQVNANWTATTGVSSILNKPAIPSTYSDVGAMPIGGVSINRKVSTGINIADITINGTATSLYAPQAGESPVYSYTLNYGAAVDSAAVLSAYNAGGIILVKDDIAPTYPIATLQAFEGNSNAIDTLTFVCFNGSKKITYFWQSDQTSVDNGWRYWEENYKGISVFEYGGTYATTDLINAINRNELLYCHVSINSTDGYDLPLISYSTDENIFSFGGARFNGSNYVLDWANWDGGWDDNGSYDLTIPKQTTWFGTCDTTASTAAKVVTISNFTNSDFKAGTIIGILFTTDNTAATPTLNINSLGAKSIYIGNTALNSTSNPLKWISNTIIYFMYDGTYFRYMYATGSAGISQPRGANTWYGTSSTAASTQAKTSTINNFVPTKGAIIAINFSTANSYNGKITLNINSTGAKDVYYKNAVTSSTNKPLWKTNSTVTFVYSGSYYYIVNIDPIPNDQLDVGAYNLSYQPQEQSINDYLDNEYDLSVGGALDATMDEFNSKSIIQLGGGTSSTVAATSGTITFVAFDSVMYKRSISGRLSLDSTGGVKVNAAGYYKVSAGLYCSCDSRAIPANGSTVYRVRKGLYIYSGTDSTTTSCTEYASNIIYSDDSYGMCIGPMIIHANQNDKIYLAFRPMGGPGTYNAGNKASYLLVEEMPSPYPTS